MASRQLDEEAIFHIARQLASADARATYLDQVCAGDASLRERVEALLRIHEQEQSFLNSSSPNLPPTAAAEPLAERPGTTIGRYRLMEQIGEGGMGVVFVAEQEKPIRRKVALKVIKPGMDTKEVIARFEAERQALALMDHPNIAKVLDAGSTESGLPYFVMELVRGIPITDYCDRNTLSIRHRLVLFVEVCNAVQHAHQKGIIHRDLKPANVLVTLHDSRPVPKVIDFGVAKATHQRLTERTIYTHFAQIIGTPMYMSPEQAQLSGLDVDTRSDIYALGVLLYELLTGTTPFDKQRLAQAAYDEIRRIVREEEPPKPSTKISTLGDAATAVSAHRATDPHSLCRSIQGDLDVIVMKAIEKDRTRRYDTASALGEDVQRFLKDEPIVARSPSLVYQFSKFARRHRVAIVMSVLLVASLAAGMVATNRMAVAILVLTLLVIGLVATSSMANVAQREARRATDANVRMKKANEQLKYEVDRTNQTLHMLEEASFEEAVTAALAGDREKAEKALYVAENSGASAYRVSLLNGLIAMNSGMYDEALRFAQEALAHTSPEEDPQHIGAHSLLAAASIWAGYTDLGELEQYRLRRLTPQSDTDCLLQAYATVLADPREAMRLLERTPRIQRSPVGLFIRAMANNILGLSSQQAQRIDRALQDLEYAQFLFRDNKATMASRLGLLGGAIQLARATRRVEEAVAYEAQGHPLAAELASVPDFPHGDYARYLFYRSFDKSDLASRAIRRVGRHPGLYCFILAADCLRRCAMTAAAREFDQAVADEHKQSKYVRLARAYLVRELPSGAQEVRKLVDNLLKDPSPFLCRLALSALCLVDGPDTIRERAQAVLTTVSQTPDVGDAWNGQVCLEYLAGHLTEAQILDRSGGQGFVACAAHFTIGMAQLAAGKREAAYQHFTSCAGTNVIGLTDCEMARAYIARMDADPTWPSWIRQAVDE